MGFNEHVVRDAVMLLATPEKPRPFKAYQILVRKDVLVAVDRSTTLMLTWTPETGWISPDGVAVILAEGATVDEVVDEVAPTVVDPDDAFFAWWSNVVRLCRKFSKGTPTTVTDTDRAEHATGRSAWTYARQLTGTEQPP